MSRKPKDDVAASRTITLRLTPDDRERIDRLVEARGAELPERSLSALLRKLVREAEDATMVRIAADEYARMVPLPAEERALLDRLVAARAEELARLGVYEAHVTPSSAMVGLIRDAAHSKGLVAAAVPQAPDTPSQPATVEPPVKAAAKGPTGPNPARVKAALVAALDGGTTQADIARKAGLDSGQLSRFKASGSGLSPESLTKLSKALETNA